MLDIVNAPLLRVWILFPSFKQYWNLFCLADNYITCRLLLSFFKLYQGSSREPTLSLLLWPFWVLLSTPDAQQVLSTLANWNLNVSQPSLCSRNYLAYSSAVVIICSHSWSFILCTHNLQFGQRLKGDPYSDFWNSFLSSSFLSCALPCKF